MFFYVTLLSHFAQNFSQLLGVIGLMKKKITQPPRPLTLLFVFAGLVWPFALSHDLRCGKPLRRVTQNAPQFDQGLGFVLRSARHCIVGVGDTILLGVHMHIVS